MRSVFPLNPPIIARRGARASAPENTLAALRLAHRQGAKWVQVDVTLTHDGVPIAIRGDALDRTTNGEGLVAEKTWAELRTLDAGSWFDSRFAGEPIPRLEDVLRLVLILGLRINIRLRPAEGRAQATGMVTLIEMAKMWPEQAPSPLISSLDQDCLLAAKQLQPHLPRGLLLREWRDDWYELAGKVLASTLHLKAEILTKERVALLKEVHLPILAYTVNNADRAKELLSWGVSAVFCDDPSEMIKKLST